jgi:hypothetical protein
MPTDEPASQFAPAMTSNLHLMLAETLNNLVEFLVTTAQDNTMNEADLNEICSHIEDVAARAAIDSIVRTAWNDA